MAEVFATAGQVAFLSGGKIFFSAARNNFLLYSFSGRRACEKMDVDGKFFWEKEVHKK